jgi:hypothetical protein
MDGGRDDEDHVNSRRCERRWAKQWDEAGGERPRCLIEFAQVTAPPKPYFTSLLLYYRSVSEIELAEAGYSTTLGGTGDMSAAQSSQSTIADLGAVRRV